jgi:hypothetical protein
MATVRRCKIVEVKEPLGRAVENDTDELVSEVHRILDAAV